MTAWIVGFDLSLTAPAAVALPLNWKPGDWKQMRACHIAPKAPKGDDVRGRLDRYILISEWAPAVIEALGVPRHKMPTAVKVYVEDYGYSRSNAQASKVMESGGVVKVELYKRLGLTMTPVSSSEARKLTLGFNPRKPKHDAKVVIQDTIFNKFGAPKTLTEDECDALIVVQFGLSQEGGKILTLST